MSFESYNLLAKVIRRQASIILGESAANTFEKVCQCLDEEYSTTGGEISDLLDLVNPDTCPLTLLNYLSYLVGERADPDWTELQQRAFVKNLVDYHKIKGTHHNVELRSQLIHGEAIELIELWKHNAVNPLESTNYNREQTGFYPFKSARLDVLSCTGTCETLSETDVEYMTPAEAEEYLNSLGDVLPVHVLVRKNFEETEASDLIGQAYDDLGCSSVCETVCETACELGEEDWVGSKIYGTPRDEFFPIREDGLVAISTCIYICETTCEDCCQCWGYGVVPDSYGETYAQRDGSFDVRMKVGLPDSDVCASACEALCEGGDPQTQSVAVVGEYRYPLHHIRDLGLDPGTTYFKYRFYPINGEDFTEKDWNKETVAWAVSAEDCSGNDITHAEREVLCTYACEADVCEAWCEQNCESDCQVFCEGSVCETFCQDYCQTNCQTACQSGFCQSGCQLTGCEGACETAEQDAYLIVEGGCVSATE